MIDYEEDAIFTLVFQREGSVAIKAFMHAFPAALLTFLLCLIDEFAPAFREDIGLLEARGSQLWNACLAILTTLLAFRTNKAYSRFWEGTSLLHQMRGEWFDSVSCCVTFSRAARDTKPKQVEDFRHTIVRLMSLCHGSALEEIAGMDGGAFYTIDPFGLDNDTLIHLRACSEDLNFNRVEVLLHLTQSLIVKYHDDGVLKIAPPILSRVFQTLSRGFVNLLNCKKITDTKFPYPYAQIISVLLMANMILTPCIISALFKNKFWAPIFTLVSVFGLFALNFIAVELENPFGDDDNDLPLEHFQHEMNSCLMMLLQDNADLMPGVRADAQKNFATLKEAFENHDEGSGHDRRRISSFGDMLVSHIHEAEEADLAAKAAQEEASKAEPVKSEPPGAAAAVEVPAPPAAATAAATPAAAKTPGEPGAAETAAKEPPPPAANGQLMPDTIKVFNPPAAEAPSPLAVQGPPATPQPEVVGTPGGSTAPPRIGGDNRLDGGQLNGLHDPGKGGGSEPAQQVWLEQTDATVSTAYISQQGAIDGAGSSILPGLPPDGPQPTATNEHPPRKLLQVTPPERPPLLLAKEPPPAERMTPKNPSRSAS
eukprot:TRINITY_DN2491_c2_g1_i1.p1 TRINITY_DN2491_c2_g1~~TRINITY_DN2491_c2_g1_i1.p1  ORF type:complete len:597 (+),score=120.29 TRINITY_DN2491_c2_g1_i1:163-1953(+)